MKQAWAARVGHLFEGCPSIVSKGILGDLDHFFLGPVTLVEAGYSLLERLV